MMRFTTRQIERDTLERRIYSNARLTNAKNFKHMVSTNMISNFPIYVANISNADKIYGPSMVSLKDNSTRKKPRPEIKDDITIPIKIYKNNSKIELCIGVVCINGISILVYIDRQAKYISTIHITTQHKESFFKYPDKILHKYNSEGFTITIIHAENEFKPLM